MNNPKFENKVKQKLIAPAANQSVTSGYAIILSYDSTTNTASVQMAEKKSPVAGAIFRNVPCPTSLGVQGVAPSLGRHCWVDFNGETDFYPVVTHLFNQAYDTIDYATQSSSVNNIPRYILGT